MVWCMTALSAKWIVYEPCYNPCMLFYIIIRSGNDQCLSTFHYMRKTLILYITYSLAICESNVNILWGKNYVNTKWAIYKNLFMVVHLRSFTHKVGGRRRDKIAGGGSLGPKYSGRWEFCLKNFGRWEKASPVSPPSHIAVIYHRKPFTYRAVIASILVTNLVIFNSCNWHV